MPTFFSGHRERQEERQRTQREEHDRVLQRISDQRPEHQRLRMEEREICHQIHSGSDRGADQRRVLEAELEENRLRQQEERMRYMERLSQEERAQYQARYCADQSWRGNITAGGDEGPMRAIRRRSTD